MSGSDTYEFVQTCLSHRSDAARREAARPFLEAGVDWNAVQRLARQHRVLPLFFRGLEDLLGPELPPPMHEQIQEHRRGVRIRNTFLAQELGRVCRRFDDAGLPLLAMKGPVLAQSAYGDIALRYSVDADVAIPGDQFSEADRLLNDLGYEPAPKRKGMSGWRASLSRYLDGQWEFTRGNTFTLDVHTRLMPPGYAFSSDFHTFWEQARPVRLADDAVVTGFSPEDRLLVLVHHGIKNQWRALRHVADVAATIRGADMDWDALSARAETMNCTRALKLGLHMARGLLDVMLPSRVEERFLDSSTENVFASMKSYLQSRPQQSSLPLTDRVHLQIATKDSLTDQVRYGAHSVLHHLWSGLLRP
ncbi:nucleotidyltransferase domain-containing protein [Salinibacter grassmerensis]|uniref:nucleotidyltransferase domain-containing protein n=1 Tax=Salinibacter grassmerensis TaxID=3040353 RepID=UPI0021E73F24|nr:nucleotidyltransferase family protein [Salinibacter grassmerensis]